MKLQKEMFLTQSNRSIIDTACHNSRNIHGIDQGNETMPWHKAVSGLQGNNTTQRSGITGWTTCVWTQSPAKKMCKKCQYLTFSPWLASLCFSSQVACERGDSCGASPWASSGDDPVWVGSCPRLCSIRSCVAPRVPDWAKCSVCTACTERRTNTLIVFGTKTKPAVFKINSIYRVSLGSKQPTPSQTHPC